MIKIRGLGTRELKQVLNLLECFTEREFADSALQKLRQLYMPLYRLNQFLPSQFQFLPAIYVAVSSRKVLGLIWLSQDGKKKNRWKIEQLIIDPEEFSYDIGSQLVHYVINRYGADGVQTFLAYVENSAEQALGLLKSCGFRLCTRLSHFSIESFGHLVFEKNDLPALRLASGSDNLKLQSLYNESLPSEVRLSLEKIPADFGKSWGQFLGEKFQGVFSKRWILEDTARDMIFASLDLVTHNYVDFQLTILVSGGYQTYFEPMVLFGIQQALKNTANAKVYLHVYDFQKMQHASLEGLGFKCLSEVSILVKDYWIPLEDRKAQSTSPILIFPGKTSPA